MPKHFYGWKRQQPDHRDLKYHPPAAVLAALPPSVDLSAKLGPVLDQGQLGSCGPNSVSGDIDYDQNAQGLTFAAPSRLFIYYATRLLMGAVNEDSGVDNRTMLKSLAQYGYCSEAAWPYDVNKYALNPPSACWSAALANRIASYAAVAQNLDTMRGTLAAGHPFVYGFTVYDSFESQAVAQTGDVPMPGKTEQVLGGHDVLFYGYDDVTQRFRFRNSWGAGWGKGGNGTMPYAYATDSNLSGDFWAVNAVPGGGPNPPPPPPPGPDDGTWTRRVDVLFAGLEVAFPAEALELRLLNRFVDRLLGGR